MKRIFKYSLALSLAMLMFNACEKDKAFPEFDSLEYGAIPRLIEGIDGPYGNAFNFSDIAGSYIEFTVEFYDENQGRNVTEYSWTVAYDGGDPVALASMSSSNFGTSPDGLPSASFKFTMTDVMAALGLTENDIEGGKSFEFQATLKKNDGKVFTSVNTSSNLQGQPAFRALFQIKTNIICTSDLGGTFDAHTVANGPWGCTNEWTGQVTFIDEGNGVYIIAAQDADHPDNPWDFSMGAYWVCYGTGATLPTDETTGDLRLTDACGKLGYSGTSRWGEVYWLNSVTVDGANLTLDWENDYGEGGVTTLTRTDGSTWPTNLRN